MKYCWSNFLMLSTITVEQYQFLIAKGSMLRNKISLPDWPLSQLRKNYFTLQWEAYGVLDLSDILPEVHYHCYKWKVGRDTAAQIYCSNFTKDLCSQDILNQTKPNQTTKELPVLRWKAAFPFIFISSCCLATSCPEVFIFLPLLSRSCNYLLTNPTVLACSPLFPDWVRGFRSIKSSSCVRRIKSMLKLIPH